MNTGDRIRDARERRGMTQTELAEIVGVSEALVALWENKKNRRNLTRKHLPKIADALGVSAAELLADDGLAFPPTRLAARISYVSLTQDERALIALYRSFPAELQLLQLAQFVECANIRKGDELAGQEASNGLPVEPASNSHPG